MKLCKTKMSDNSEFIIDLVDSLQCIIEVLEEFCPEKKDQIVIEYVKKVMDNYDLSQSDAEKLLQDLGIIFLVNEMEMD